MHAYKEGSAPYASRLDWYTNGYGTSVSAYTQVSAMRWLACMDSRTFVYNRYSERVSGDVLRSREAYPEAYPASPPACSSSHNVASSRFEVYVFV